MKDCAPEPKVASFLPDFARNAHGNLAEQNRPVGAQHGVDTTRPEVKQGVADPAPTAAPAAPAAVVAQAKPAAAPKAEAAGVDNKAALALTQKNNCTACHAIDKKILGPSFMDIAKKHAGKVDYLAGKIKSGGSGVWGPIPMPAQALSEAEAKTIGAWLAAGAGK
jgi:cytochrome c